jgi:hypothetical protein
MSADRSLDVSGRKEKAGTPVPLVDEITGSPHWRPAIRCLPECQNVAGLWLKYGAKPFNIDNFPCCENLFGDVTIVDENR